MSSLPLKSPLPLPRRIVTGHSENGDAIFTRDSIVPLESTKGAIMKVIWRSDEFPCDCSEPFKDPIDIVTKDIATDGIVYRIVDM